MTFDNLKIVITNAYCCIARLGTKVSDLYSNGNKCADSELAKLKILEDRVKVLEEYYCENKRLLLETFDADSNLQEWNPTVGVWSWVSKNINIPPGNVSLPGTGGYASFEGEETYGDIYKDVLTVGQKYRVEFDMYVSFNLEEFDYTTIRVFLGDTELTYQSEVNDVFFHVILEGTCTNNTRLTFRMTDVEDQIVPHGIDNIQVYPIVNNCLTDDQMNTVIHQVMEQCNICDCQLQGLTSDNISEEFDPGPPGEP